MALRQKGRPGMKFLLAGLAVTILVLASPLPAMACVLSFPPQAVAGGQSLVLNGQGWRIVSPWGIKAYAAALYQSAPTRDRGVALQPGRPWVVEMVYCRNASVADIREVWLMSLRRSCWTGCGLAEEPTRQFLAALDDARPAARWRFAFDGERLEIADGNGLRGSIVDPAFARVLLATWIGAVPSTVELRDALLGKP